MNKCIVIFVFLILHNLSSWAQIYPHDYPDYEFINQDKNKLQFSSASNFSSFLEALNDLFSNGDRNINIVHFGGSHIQADVWSHRIREHFHSLMPQNSGGRGLVFPYRIIKTNGSPYVKFKSDGEWKGFRNSILKHYSEFGLTGITAKTKDSSTTIQLNINKKKCHSCSFNSLKIIHNQTTHFHALNFMDKNGWDYIEIVAVQSGETTTFKYVMQKSKG